MTTKVQQWGNSLAVRLPRGVAERLRLERGSEVAVLPGARHIMIRPVSRKKVTLKELVAGITTVNRHGEVRVGSPRGKEIW